MTLYNTVHYGIKKDQISFIYILIKRSKNNIWMALYHKPAETQRFLLFTSSRQTIARKVSYSI